jgi:hypothetical protein
MTFGLLTFSTTLFEERQKHKVFSCFYNCMSENIGPDDMFIVPRMSNQVIHLTGVSADLFPGHVHIGKEYGG